MLRHAPRREGTLFLTNGNCLIGITDSGSDATGGATIPLNFGDQDSMAQNFEVEFKNFKNITHHQVAYAFDLGMGSNIPSVEGMVLGAWFRHND